MKVHVQSPNQPSPYALASSKDRLAYVADMLEQLEQLATEVGQSKLSGLIALAAAEARLAAGYASRPKSKT